MTQSIRWIRDGHPDAVLDIHEPGYYKRATEETRSREQILRDGITKALDMMQGTQNDLRAFKARAFLLAALEEAK